MGPSELDAAVRKDAGRRGAAIAAACTAGVAAARAPPAAAAHAADICQVASSARYGYVPAKASTTSSCRGSTSGGILFQTCGSQLQLWSTQAAGSSVQQTSRSEGREWIRTTTLLYNSFLRCVFMHTCTVCTSPGDLKSRARTIPTPYAPRTMLTNSYSTSIAGPRSCASPWSSLPVPASRGTAVARRAPLAYAKRRGPGSRTTGANNTGDKPPPVPGPADGPKPSSDSGAASGGASSAPPKWGGDNKWWVNPPARLRASNRGEVAVADFDMEPRWIETAAKVLLDAGAIASHPVSATLQKIQQRSGVIVWCAVNGPWRMEVVLVDDVRAPLAMRLLRCALGWLWNSEVRQFNCSCLCIKASGPTAQLMLSNASLLQGQGRRCVRGGDMRGD